MVEALQNRVARLLRERHDEASAVEFDGRWYTWQEMRKVAGELTAALAQAGLDSHAPVAFISRNRPSAMAAVLGLLADSRIIFMLYAFQSATVIAQDIARQRPAALIAGADLLSDELLDSLREQGIAVIAISDMKAELVAGFERTRTAAATAQPGDLRVEILSSGTTGPPKRFPVPYDTILRFMLAETMLDDASAAAEAPSLIVMPLGNISGLTATLSPLLNGRRCVLLDRFSLQAWHEYVLRYRPTAGGLPPAGFQMLLDADFPKEDLASIQFMSTGAAPLDPVVHRAFTERYDIPVLLSYGATEFAGPVAAMTPALFADWGESKFGSVGRAMPGVSLRVVDPSTSIPIPDGREGILEVITPRRGPDWIRTSDIAVIDEDGFLFLRGRADGAIIRGGFKILPETIERALLEHPQVADAVVVGVSDHRLGQVPGACVRLKPAGPEVVAAALEAHLRRLVLSTHIPVHWRFVEELPRTPSFKIDRGAIREAFEAQVAKLAPAALKA